MCGTYLCSELPQSTLTLRVTFCHSDGHWHASWCQESLFDDGVEVIGPGGHHDFGPFDMFEDVWSRLCAQLAECLHSLRDTDRLA